MPPETHPLVKLLRRDARYRLEAYQFVREALSYAQDVMGIGGAPGDELQPFDPESEEPADRHITGPDLCRAIRQYALDQYGYMAKVVLESWGLHSTSDFGEIVYNLINAGLMKKSDDDRREDFDDVYDFDEAFREQFEITMSERPAL